jgi:hypothetical protein
MTAGAPTLLEHLPYRKDDAMLVRDELYSYTIKRGAPGQ